MAIFRRAHYLAIAKVIARNLEDSFCLNEARFTTIDVARDLANLFYSDNPNFNRARFLKACGMEDL